MSGLTGMDALRRKLGSIKHAIENDIFEEAGHAWVEQDFKPAAKQLAPVASGELRDSIDGEVNPQQIRVFASADHARFVEEGTVKQSAQPFMEPAFQKTRRKLAAHARAALKKRL